MATIGKRNTLTVLRDSTSGIYLDVGCHGEILLPNRYVPRGVVMGDRLGVFVYRDSEDRLVATTETPRATVGEVATLRVISIHRQVGAFLDLGLAKDLLLPFREQAGPVKVGHGVVVRIYLDEETQRIVASMNLGKGLDDRKLGEELTLDKAKYRPNKDCRTLVCFVYDPEGCCKNPTALERDLAESGPDFNVLVVVAPKGG